MQFTRDLVNRRLQQRLLASGNAVPEPRISPHAATAAQLRRYFHGLERVAPPVARVIENWYWRWRDQSLPAHATSAVSLPETPEDDTELQRLVSIPDDAEFIRTAYRTLLRREVDWESLTNCLDQCHRSVPRRCILHQIVRSPEGTQAGASLPGLWRPLSVAQLLALPDPEFLPASYRSVLWREVEERHRQTLQRQMRAGRSRADVLRELVQSPEAQNLPLRIEGSEQLKRDWSRMAWMVRTAGPGTMLAPAVNAWRTARSRLRRRRVTAGPLDRLQETVTQTEARLRDLTASVAELSSALARVAQTGSTSAEEVASLRGAVETLSTALPAAAEAVGTKAARDTASLRQTVAALSGAVEAISLKASHDAEALRAGVDDLSSALSGAIEANALRAAHEGRFLRAKVDALSSTLLEQVEAGSARAAEDIESVRRTVEAGSAKAAEDIESLRRTVEVFSATMLHAIEASASRSSEEAAALRGEVGGLNERIAVTVAEQAGTLREVIAAGMQTLEGRSHELEARSHEEDRRIAARLAAVEGQMRGAGTFLCGDVVVTRYGDFLLSIPSEDVRLAAWVSLRGSLEPGLDLFLAATVTAGMTVVDVGANIGLHTLPLSRHVGPTGRVFCFEPSPRVFPILEVNVAMNGFADRVTAVRAAITDKEGSADLYVMKTCGHTTLFDIGGSVATVQTRTAALDAVLPGGLRCDLVKIDAEGAEPLVLRGMRGLLRTNPALQIVMEFGPEHLIRAGLSPRVFLGELLSQFSVRHIDDLTGSLREITDASALDDVFSANLLLVPSGSGEQGH